MDSTTIQQLYAGNNAVHVFEMMSRDIGLLQDVVWLPNNDNAAYKSAFTFGALELDNVGAGLYGEAAAPLTDSTHIVQTKQTIEIYKSCVIPTSIYNTAPDKEQLINQEVGITAKQVALKGIFTMFNSTFVLGSGIGWDDAYHQTGSDFVIDAEGAGRAYVDMTNAVTAAWVVHWSPSSAVLGFPGSSPAGVDVGEPMSQIFMSGGAGTPSTVIPVWWRFACVAKVPNAVIKIENLDPPVDSSAKVLTKDLLIKALYLLDGLEGGNISIVAHPTQISTLVSELSGTSNLIQSVSSGNALTPIFSFMGAKLRPCSAIPYVEA